MRISENSLELAKRLALAAIVAAAALLCVCHASCQLTSQGIQALDAEESPQIQNVSIVNASSIAVDFSKPVSVQSASISRLDAGQKASIDAAAESPVKANAVISNEGKSVLYVFESKAMLGERYQLFSEIKDIRGNSLTFALPFDGFNDRLPACVLAEVQNTAYKGKTGVNPESPYVTIRALEDGNLFGLDLYCAANKISYPLPKVEVKAGDEITLHLKATSKEGDCVDELGDNIALAATGRSSPLRRDLFFKQSASSLHSKNDVVLLRDRNSNKIMDALSYYKIEDNATRWNLPDILEQAIADKAWIGSASAESSFLINDPKNKSGATRPLVRKTFPTAVQAASREKPSSKYDWAVSQAVY